jgi:hypothetical protein
VNREIQATIYSAYNEGLKTGLEAMNGWKRLVYLIVELETYASMEGLEGFYRSDIALHATEVAKALAMIGAEQSANLIRRANTILTSVNSSMSSALDSLDEEQIKEFDSIAEAFSKSPDSRSKRLEEFVAKISTE